MMRPPPSRDKPSPSLRLVLTLLLSATLCLLCLSPTPALASQGDRSPEYRQCVDSCISDSCIDRIDVGIVEPANLPWTLRFMGWTCDDDCRYHCTHRITNQALQRVQDIELDLKSKLEQQQVSGEVEKLSPYRFRQKLKQSVEAELEKLRPVQKQMVQYHGKWVFVRFLGAQEPLSVLFSLLNLRVHAKAVFQLRRRLPDLFPLKLLYILHALVSCNAWVWSSVFHSRDKNWTERMDYFSAAAVILSGFFFTSCRLFRLSPASSRSFLLLSRACIVGLLLHIAYLSLGRFDYAYNMTINLCFGMAHNLLWLAYSFRPSIFPSNPLADRSATSRAALRATKPPSSLANGSGMSTPPVPVSAKTAGPPSSSPRSRRRLQLILALTTSAVLLEVLDFPPVMRILDAHSLWHLSTIPLAKMWYDWLIEDASECVSSGWWVGEGRSGGDMASNAASAIEKFKTWASEKLKGRAAAYIANSVELNALTNKLNALAGKAGLVHGSGASSANGGPGDGLSEREREKVKELGERGLV
ncbi:Per1-domain-containing protein [Violaceomyces palustris]|uniref:Per1-domain-containing protein n=1 Tax=Violaceomyces palustris TaxID=1673888 RepID=A0ACD0NY68_9BASI|nr:Per1-domain-containing protein [Violaceomyces palustris]